MRDLPNWVLLAAGTVGALWLYRRFNVARDAAKNTGEAISSRIFTVLNPSLSKEQYNKPTVVIAGRVGDRYVCPTGYRYKLTERGEHLCFRTD